MARIATVVLLAIVSSWYAATNVLLQSDRLTSYVDPFIGTGGHGHTFPGPSLPFGMIQPGPDTRLTGWDGCSGYHYSDTRIYRLLAHAPERHRHLRLRRHPADADDGRGEAEQRRSTGTPGYSSSFTHATEEAAPGYYAVTLNDYGVRAELTATLRAGLHRYKFPAGRPAPRRARPRRIATR